VVVVIAGAFFVTIAAKYDVIFALVAANVTLFWPLFGCQLRALREGEQANNPARAQRQVASGSSMLTWRDWVLEWLWWSGFMAAYVVCAWAIAQVE
jgi:hypothetical protein